MQYNYSYNRFLLDSFLLNVKAQQLFGQQRMIRNIYLPLKIIYNNRCRYFIFERMMHLNHFLYEIINYCLCLHFQTSTVCTFSNINCMTWWKCSVAVVLSTFHLSKVYTYFGNMVFLRTNVMFKTEQLNHTVVILFSIICYIFLKMKWKLELVSVRCLLFKKRPLDLSSFSRSFWSSWYRMCHL